MQSDTPMAVSAFGDMRVRASPSTLFAAARRTPSMYARWTRAAPPDTNAPSSEDAAWRSRLPSEAP
jgi:hypothetical protein